MTVLGEADFPVLMFFKSCKGKNITNYQSISSIETEEEHAFVTIGVFEEVLRPQYLASLYGYTLS